MASSQSKFYGVLGVIALAGIALIGYVATREDPLAGVAPSASGLEPASSAELVSVDAGISRGSLDASVTVEEYASLLCPHCGMFAQLTQPQVMERYVDTGKVRYVFFDFPLDPLSQLGSEAARCALEQDAFWPMHDILFARAREWGAKRNPTGLFGDYAESLGLDGGALEECVDSHRYLEAVQASRTRGEQLGVDRTPTFLINGRRATGALGIDQMAEILEEELAKG